MWWSCIFHNAVHAHNQFYGGHCSDVADESGATCVFETNNDFSTIMSNPLLIPDETWFVKRNFQLWKWSRNKMGYRCMFCFRKSMLTLNEYRNILWCESVFQLYILKMKHCNSYTHTFNVVHSFIHSCNSIQHINMFEETSLKCSSTKQHINKTTKMRYVFSFFYLYLVIVFILYLYICLDRLTLEVYGFLCVLGFSTYIFCNI